MNNKENSVVISIAGMVGVGKSTLSKKLAERLDFELSLEQVENNPYLDKYYNDFLRWGFHLQIFFLAKRFKELKTMLLNKANGYVQDRTIFEDFEIFTKMNYEKGNITLDDYKTYEELFESVVMAPFFKKPDMIIYLEGNLEEILQRVHIRGRDSELATEKEYWEQLYNRYNEWIDSYTHTPVLRLNINDYDVKDEKSIEVIVEKIKTIIEENNEDINI